MKRSTDHISSHLDPMCATSNIHLLPSSAAPRFKTVTHIQQTTDLFMVMKRSDFLLVMSLKELRSLTKPYEMFYMSTKTNSR